ncbi:MAG: hypothetical protein K0R13_3612, partial [Propionibacteriaceae bacterium]|nr:hypothetical protein [Propionibacteriaceae bacterium]
NERSAGCFRRSQPAVSGNRERIHTLHDDVQAELQLFQGDFVRDGISDWSERMRERGPSNNRVLDAVNAYVRRGRTSG